MNIDLDINAIKVWVDLNYLAEAKGLVELDEGLMRDMLAQHKMEQYEALKQARRIDKEYVFDARADLKKHPVELVEEVFKEWNAEHKINLSEDFRKFEK